MNNNKNLRSISVPNRRSQYPAENDPYGTQLIDHYLKLYKTGIIFPSDGFCTLYDAIVDSKDHEFDLAINEDAKNAKEKALNTLIALPYHSEEDFMEEFSQNAPIIHGEAFLRKGKYVEYPVNLDQLPPSISELLKTLPVSERSDFLMGFLIYMVPLFSKTTGAFQYQNVTCNLNALILQDKMSSKALLRKLKSKLSDMNMSATNTIEISSIFQRHSPEEWTSILDKNLNLVSELGFNSYVFKPSVLDVESVGTMVDKNMLDHLIIINSCDASSDRLTTEHFDHDERMKFDDALDSYLEKLKEVLSLGRFTDSLFMMSNEQYEAFVERWNDISQSWVQYYGIEVRELCLAIAEIAFKLCMIISSLRVIDENKSLANLQCTDMDVKMADDLAIVAFINSLQLRRQYGQRDYLYNLTTLTLSEIGDKPFKPEIFFDIYTRYGGGAADAWYILNLDPYEIFFQDSDGFINLRANTYEQEKLSYG